MLGAKIEIREMVKEFGSVRALDRLSITVEAGSFFTVLGPSGSGKTTTLNLIAGFETPTSGEVFVNGVPIIAKPPYKRNIGMVFQNYALFPHMTAADNIAFPLRTRNLSQEVIREKVMQSLQMVKLQDHWGRYPKQLSGGQQQRIALARALVFQPSLLLMDEPLGALDKKLREGMQIEIKHIQKSLGITVIYVTHDQEEALTMSDRIAILNNGRLEQEGTPLEIYESPRNRFVADFIGETNLLDGEIRTEGNHSIIDLYSVGVHFAVPPEASFKAGKVLVSIRPEKLWIETSGGGQPEFYGEIEELIYVGDNTKYLVKTSGQMVVVKQQNRKETAQLKKGNRARVRFNPAELTVFHKDYLKIV
jgi:spermidine/putrescine ABC transporter ATP-binding subunit